MIYKLLIFLLYIWTGVYTSSFAVYEYKNKNPRGAIGTVFVLILLTVAVAGVMFKKII